MFDAHIQFYAYNNIEGDDFGVGYLGNKQDWIERINRWNRNDGVNKSLTIEDWDELDCKTDLRGLQLAEVVPEDKELVVTWLKKDDDISMRIDKNGEPAWENNPQNIPTFPKWTNRLKKMISEKNLS